MPYIKLTAKKDSMLGSYPAMEITGTDLAKNEEWTKKFFKGKQNEPLVIAMNDIDVGDDVNVAMEQDPKNAKWWNIKSITLMTDEDRKKLENKQAFTKGGGGSKPAAAAATSVRRADGGSRGDDTNRSAAIYLARELVKMSVESQSEPLYVSPEVYAMDCIRIANSFILPYIKDGTLPPAEEIKDTPAPTKGKLPTTRV
jgi:hypothetical protein